MFYLLVAVLAILEIGWMVMPKSKWRSLGWFPLVVIQVALTYCYFVYAHGTIFS